MRGRAREGGVATALLDASGRIASADAAFAATVGMAREELPGRELLEFVHPEDRDAVRHGRLTSFRSGQISADLRWSCAGGETRWMRVSIRPAQDEEDGLDGLHASLTDIDDLKRAEEALRREALFDAETDLPAHRLFEDRLAMAIHGAARDASAILVGVVRIDASASVTRTSERLAGSVRASDTVARLGRREFGLVLPGASAERLAEVVPAEGIVAVGVAVYPEDGESPAELEAVATARAAATPAAVESAGEATDYEERLRALQPVSVFLPASEQVLARLARYSSRQTTLAGADLELEWGRPSLHVVQSGLVEVLAGGGGERVMTLGPNDFIGSDHDHRMPPVRVRAARDTVTLVVSEDLLEQVAPVGSPLRSSIRQALSQRSSQVEQLSARIALRSEGGTRIAVYSTKGGAGRTTVATNLASALAAEHPSDVLVVDLSLPFNHVALLANLAPSTCLARLQGIDSWAFGHSLRAALLGHPDGFLVLPSALRPEEADLVTAELVARAIDELAPQFRFVVFDVGPALNDVTIATLDRTDRVVALVTPELAALHDTRSFLEIAVQALRIPRDSIDVVLNHRAPHSAVDAKAVEGVIGRGLAGELGYSGARPEKTGLAGILSVRQAQASPLGEGIRAYARLVAERPAAQPA